MTTETKPGTALTPEQARIVEWGDGPAVVIAGAGTGKTRVIVERVRHLLETHEDLVPEQILVLTYNVKAAHELRVRLDATVGIAARSRMIVSNFHSFCQRILTESAGDAGLPPRPDVLDGIAQVLLLKDIRPELGLVYQAPSGKPERLRRLYRDRKARVRGRCGSYRADEVRRVITPCRASSNETQAGIKRSCASPPAVRSFA